VISRRLFFWSSLWVLAAGCALTPAQAQNPNFAFSNLIDRDHSNFVFLGTPSMGPTGTVVFSGATSSSEPESVYAIVNGVGSPVTVVAPSPTFFRIGSGTASVNAAGTFVFSVYHSGGGSEIYRTDTPGGPYTSVATSPNDRMNDVDTSITAYGRVVYVEESPFEARGVYTVADGTRTAVALEGALFASISGRAVINDEKMIVFGATLKGSGVAGLFAVPSQGGTSTAVIKNTGSFDSFASGHGNHPALNASGAVAFHATLDNGENGIYLGHVDGRAPVTILDSTGPLQLFGDPAIGPQGQLAFVAITDTGRTSLYYADGQSAQLLLTYGDPLFGGTFSSGNFGSTAFADDGRLAFQYNLTNGNSGIGLISIPEPASWTLALGALLVLGSRRHRYPRATS
jgi:hypothetical protein